MSISSEVVSNGDDLFIAFANCKHKLPSPVTPFTCFRKQTLATKSTFSYAFPASCQGSSTFPRTANMITQESRIQKRRKVSWNNGLQHLYARFRRLIRRLRAKVRKFQTLKRSPSFHYDALSYSMNFDEGKYVHASLYVPSPRCAMKFQQKLIVPQITSSTTAHTTTTLLRTVAGPSLWERRQFPQPKTLEISRK